ncbi:MAG: hypothetical protein HZA59_02855 [Hydrogenophilales bacterium]|nr:hypothetical protein [Hydrogenophilales bacterium]
MGNSKDQGYLADIAMALHEAMPHTLLAIGPQADEVFAEYVRANPSAVITHVAEGDWLDQVSTAGRFDFVFISGVLEYLPKRNACTLLASLRDVHAKQLYALAPIGKAWLKHSSFWEYNDLLGLGMEGVNVYAQNGLPLALLKFDLRTYKTTPEWFNSKYWARPELWD